MRFQFQIISFFLITLFSVRLTGTELVKNYLPAEQKFGQKDAPVPNTPESIREKISLVGDWQARRLNTIETTPLSVPGLFTFSGSVIFQRSFFVKENFKHRHLKLVAEGINYRSSIFINDKFVGTHYGGFTRFTYDIEPELLHFGEDNEIRILVDNWLDARLTIPAKHRPFAEKNFGGIHREIYIQVRPKLMIDDFTFQLLPGADSTEYRLAARIMLRNLTKTSAANSVQNQRKTPYRLRLTLREVRPNRKMVAQQSIFFGLNSNILQTHDISLELKNPRLWSPEFPYLHQLEITLELGKQTIDYLQHPVGLRTLSIQGNQLICNQKAYYLKGVELHNDWTPGAVTQNSDYLKKTVSSIKNLGMNAVRVVGFPPAPFFIELCNQEGLFVFEELPVQFIPKARFQEPGWLELAELQFNEMILRDRNQPCVIAWGIGAGLATRHPEVQRYLAHIRLLIKQQDWRPAYTVVSAFNFTPTPLPTDFCFLETFDLTRTNLNQLIENAERHLSSKPLFFSIGYPFNQGQTTSISQTQKESRQSYFLGLAAQRIITKSTASGIFINALADWHLTYPTSLFGPEKPLDVAPYGLISVNGEKRLAYHHLSALFSADKKIPLTAIQTREEPTNFFTLTGIGLLFLFVYFYKRDRRIRVDLRRTIQRPHGFITDIRENRKVPIFETIGLSLFITAVVALMTATLLFHYKDNFYFDQLLNLFLIKPILKERMIQLIWHPEALLPVLFLFYYLLFCSFSILIKLFAKVFSKKTSLHKAITYTFWSNSVFLFLLPAGPVLPKALNYFEARPFIFGIPGLVILFGFFRTVRGLSVLYFEKGATVLFVFLSISVAVILSLTFFYQKSYALFDYLFLYLNHLL